MQFWRHSSTKRRSRDAVQFHGGRWSYAIRCRYIRFVWMQIIPIPRHPVFTPMNYHDTRLPARDLFSVRECFFLQYFCLLSSIATAFPCNWNYFYEYLLFTSHVFYAWFILFMHDIIFYHFVIFLYTFYSPYYSARVTVKVYSREIKNAQKETKNGIY